jgi:hypothetical protein
MISLAMRAMVMLLASSLASSILGSAAFAQAAPNRGAPGQMAEAKFLLASGRHGRPSFEGTTSQGHKESYYKMTWGVDQLEVRKLASGSMLQFRYRVIDPERAKLLNNRKVAPFLIDDATGAKLQVPEAERIGKLRTTTTPQAGRTYWVLFDDALHLVRYGSRVSVEIGSFRVDGLPVE